MNADAFRFGLRVMLPVFLVLAVATVALNAWTGDWQAAAQEDDRLTLAPHYEVQRVDPPDPVENGRMAWLGMANAGDLTGDGNTDLLVPQYDAPGRIYVISGADGEHVFTIRPPVDDDASPNGFQYPAKLPDVGSCPHADAAPGEECPDSEVGPPDGTPDILVGAHTSDAELDGEVVPSLGRAYVYDGSSGALIKRVQMPEESLRQENENFPDGKGFSFGRSVTSLDSPFQTDAPEAVQIGDMSGDGSPDFAVGNPTFLEDSDSNPNCDDECEGAGRVFVYNGGDIAGSDPSAVLDDAHHVLQTPRPLTVDGHERFGHAIMAVGDQGACDAEPDALGWCPDGERNTDPDGTPNIAVSQHRADSLGAGHEESGVVWLFDGTNGAALRQYTHPAPQSGALFGYIAGAMPEAIGDVANTSHPDILVPAVGQAVDKPGQGRGYVMNGNFTTSQSNILLSVIDDPKPGQGGNFSAPYTGIGDVHGDPRNEILVGAAGPLWPSGTPVEGNAVVYSPSTDEVALTLDDPDDEPGSGFGQGVAQIGDTNDSGYMDFAVTAGYFDSADALGSGRLYIFRGVDEPDDGDDGSNGDGNDDDGNDEPSGEVSRLAGPDRFATAAEISQTSFEPGVDVAYVATGGDFPDALTGGVAAARNGGPALLVTGDSIPDVTANELERLDPGRIVVLGGAGVVSSPVEAQLANFTDGEVSRLAGSDRFATAAEISQASFEAANTDVAYVATGLDFPDALAGVPGAAVNDGPLLLATADTVPEATAAELERLDLDRIVVLGGDGVIGSQVESELGGFADDVSRLAGSNRFATAATISADTFDTAATLYVATGLNFPDALTGGAVAGAVPAPVMLVTGADIPDATRDEITRLNPERIVILGGEGAVSSAVASELGTLIGAE